MRGEGSSLQAKRCEDGGPRYKVEERWGMARMQGEGSTWIVLSQIHSLVTSVTRREDVRGRENGGKTGGTNELLGGWSM